MHRHKMRALNVIRKYDWLMIETTSKVCAFPNTLLFPKQILPLADRTVSTFEPPCKLGSRVQGKKNRGRGRSRFYL